MRDLNFLNHLINTLCNIELLHTLFSCDFSCYATSGMGFIPKIATTTLTCILSPHSSGYRRGAQPTGDRERVCSDGSSQGQNLSLTVLCVPDMALTVLFVPGQALTVLFPQVTVEAHNSPATVHEFAQMAQAKAKIWPRLSYVSWIWP